MEIELLREKIGRLETSRPLRAQEVETMSQATSPSTGKPYGLARVCRVWGVARSTVYWQRHASCCAWRPPGARWSLCG